MAASKAIGPQVPLPRPLARALEGSDALAGLGARIALSRRRFEAIAALLPEPWARELRPGPIDEEGWSLIAPNAAVAAKLRHHLPRLQEELQRRGWPELPIRVRQAGHQS
jgi:hypothetical protein